MELMITSTPKGLGHLDACNGHFGLTPDFPQGIYHYHTTMQNGNGDMGFPYFLICYHGEADMSSDAGAVKAVVMEIATVMVKHGGQE